MHQRQIKPPRLLPYLLFCLVIGSFITSCPDEPYPLKQYQIAADHPAPPKARTCTNASETKNAYFGDSHVHTSISSDSWMFDVRLLPEDAHRFAFGETVYLPPNDATGNPTRPARIDRPLDFIAVTDHAEFLGESWLCSTPSSAIYDSNYCNKYRAGHGRSFQLAKHIFSPIGFRDDEACGKDGQRCRDAARNNWQRVINAAEKWNDTSENCERSAFIAYEYSSFRLGSNLHRNVIFKNNIVPNLPISYIEEPLEWNFWQRLNTDCKLSNTGCDVLAIPHNSNISNGRMFNIDYYSAETPEQQIARATLRSTIEPLIEIYQHKGDSECRNGIDGVLNSTDELCQFERFENNSIYLTRDKTEEEADDCPDTGKWAHLKPHLGPDCISRLNYARYALIEGLNEQKRLGVNPFKFGLTASTDTHNATAGGVEERSYQGHLGMGDNTPSKRTNWNDKIEGNANNSPGGLFGVWSTQNTRADLFEAMQRKEVFGTSGPRIKPRFFGGWHFPADICSNPDLLETAYQIGVPMGGDLPPLNETTKTETSPYFIALASADAGTATAPGTPLQRLQIIKGWVDQEGKQHSQVFDAAGKPNNGASVNTKSCQQSGEGFAQLCTIWQDPDFNADLNAVYYLRAVENPSCRYNAWQCINLEGADRPADCDIENSDRPKIIQERAWSSPIWYTADQANP